MPYITYDRRYPLDFEESAARTAGELNYILTTEVLNYIVENKLSYATLNEVIGVLECVKQELYSRLGGDYEDLKIKKNGDLKFYEEIRQDYGLSQREPDSRD